MKVFLGSSTESLATLREIASWVEEAQHEPLTWDAPTLFLPGDNTFSKLIEISKKVDAAIFVFAEDDHLWYRADGVMQPRDNLLIEYGLFAGALGQARVAICKDRSPKDASDLRGIILKPSPTDAGSLATVACAAHRATPRSVTVPQKSCVDNSVVYSESGESAEPNERLPPAKVGRLMYVDSDYARDGRAAHTKDIGRMGPWS